MVENLLKCEGMIYVLCWEVFLEKVKKLCEKVVDLDVWVVFIIGDLILLNLGISDEDVSWLCG